VSLPVLLGPPSDLNVLRMELGSHIPRVKEIQERLRMDVILVLDQMELLGTGHWRVGLVLVTLLVVEREDRGQIMEVQDKTVEVQDRIMEVQDRIMEDQDRIMEVQDRIMEFQGRTMEVQDKTIVEDQDKIMEVRGQTMEDPDKVMEVRGQIMEEVVVEEDQEGIRTITTIDPSRLQSTLSSRNREAFQLQVTRTTDQRTTTRSTTEMTPAVSVPENNWQRVLTSVQVSPLVFLEHAWPDVPKDALPGNSFPSYSCSLNNFMYFSSSSTNKYHLHI